MRSSTRFFGVLAAVTVPLGVGAPGLSGASTTKPSAVATAHSGPRAANTGASTVEIPFLFTIRDLPTHRDFVARYRSGVVESSGGDARATKGDMEEVDFANSDTRVTPGSAPLDAEITAWLTVDAAAITGVPEIPAGANVTLNNPETGRTITLSNGVEFSLPTGHSG